MRKQLIGTGAITRQIRSQNQDGKQLKLQKDNIQWEQMANRVGSYVQEGGYLATQTKLKVEWTNIRWNITETLTPKTGNREPHRNHRHPIVSNELLLGGGGGGA